MVLMTYLFSFQKYLTQNINILLLRKIIYTISKNVLQRKGKLNTTFDI